MATGHDSVRITKVQSRRHILTRRGLVCVPSAFIWPHVYIGDVPGRPLHMISPGRWLEHACLAGQTATPYAAPLRAETLAGLPPAPVVGAGRDPLRDDACDYAARPAADGVAVRHVEYGATMHAFLDFAAVMSAADHAVDVIAASPQEQREARAPTAR